MRKLILAGSALVTAMMPLMLLAEGAKIQIRPDRLGPPLTRYMTGACIEDVNHEIYGGIYSQMIFGESFQEPPPLPIDGFQAYGGDWSLRDGVISVGRDEGPKLISEHPPIATGEVGVEVFLPGESGGVAGLIVKVREPGTGADRFIGYEIALDSQRQVLVLGRHRHNWEPIRNVPCEVRVDSWVSLAVRMGERTLEVLVDGKQVVQYEDKDHPLPTGAIGLRPFQRECRYRNLWVKTEERLQAIPFASRHRWSHGVSGMWRAIRGGSAEGHFELLTEKPFAGHQSQRIVLSGDEGELGIENQGLNRWGLCLRERKPYEGYLWARTAAPATLHVAMESRDGSEVYAEAQLEAAGDSEWQRLDFTLTPRAANQAARFAIRLRRPGAVDLGHVFLQPGEWGRFKGLPLRKDIVDGLIEQGITVLRYGGSMINAPDYRWKKMIGPRDRRPPYRGTWYPHSTNGWGILDFLDLCEAAGILGIPAFNMDEAPQDMADFIEYVNGPADSPWGARRAADGHPRPYGLRHIQLGNEEAVNEEYWRRFKPLAEAIWARDRDITIVVGDFAYDKPIVDPFHFEGAPSIRTLAVHKKILDLAVEHAREVWFDVHVWNHEPRDPEGLRGLPSFIDALGKLNPQAGYKVVVFELNAVNHAVRRALGNAHAINELERIGDRVPIVCSANCLQPDGQNDNGWDQGLLFLNPCKVWGQPPCHVTRMLSQNWLPHTVEAEVESPGEALDVTAKTSADTKVLHLQVVNLEGRAIEATILLGGFAPTQPVARVVELSGRLDDVNTADQPHRIVPATREWRHEYKDGHASYIFPAHSFTILRWE